VVYTYVVDSKQLITMMVYAIQSGMLNYQSPFYHDKIKINPVYILLKLQRVYT
jgi:hypothetical protein